MQAVSTLRRECIVCNVFSAPVLPQVHTDNQQGTLSNFNASLADGSFQAQLLAYQLQLVPNTGKHSARQQLQGRPGADSVIPARTCPGTPGPVPLLLPASSALAYCIPPC